MSQGGSGQIRSNKQLMGVCAAGHPLTAAAGARALSEGGNAIDAAVAAQLMASVAEPLLTGLGGAGLAMVRFDGRDRALDFFADRPGLGLTRPIAPLERVEVSFGVDVQRFFYGVGSVATPGMIWGLWELHRAGGRIPLPRLARWAADQAERGVEVNAAARRVMMALAPILERDDYLRGQLMTQDHAGLWAPAPVGHRYSFPKLSETLMRWAEGGPSAIFSGVTRDAIFGALGDFTSLSAADIEHYQARWRAPIERALPLRSGARARLLTPGLPSQGGVQISALLGRVASKLSERSPHQLDPLGGEALSIIATEMRELELKKGEGWPRALTSVEDPYWLDQLGFTTHISASDREGNSVGITSSLGETAGLSVAELGLTLNNFLGETDVAPAHCMPEIGERLYTMCSPTLFEYETTGGSRAGISQASGSQVIILGSGGSSRIRSVVAQGALYAHPELLGITGAVSDLSAQLNAIVEAPRVHYEDRKLRIETFDRPEEALEVARQLCSSWGETIIKFDDFNLFFGGLNLSSTGVLGLGGAGDPRRAGAVDFG